MPQTDTPALGEPAKPSVAQPVVYTIGHSARPLDEFLGLLQANGVRLLLDVRTMPRSRHNPQFNRETLPDSLRAIDAAYLHLPGLGGLRKTHVDSGNGGWRNLSFRGYADYMQTAEFADDVQRVAELADKQCCALMCAEAVPWRCHRSLSLTRSSCVAPASKTSSGRNGAASIS